MKVLLIFPYVTLRMKGRPYPVEPLGLLSLATFIRKEMAGKDIDIEILDALFEGPDDCLETERGFRVGMRDEQIRDRAIAFAPDLVGIANNYTFNTRDVLDLAALIKATLPKATVILGGAHATIDHENLIRYPDIDIVARGEGEETLKEVILAMADGKDMSGVLGITWKTGEEAHINDDRPLIPDINTLPIPDRGLIPYQSYLEKTSGHYFHTMNSPIGTVFTSRGCPFKCIFCSTQRVWRNKWRPRSAEKMIEEVEYLVNEYGVKEIAFQDDQFMGDKERIKAFCRLVLARNLKLTFITPPGISPSLIDNETMDLMRKAGFYRICFSIDVGTEEARRFVRKPLKLGSVRSLIRNANAKGFWTYGTFVIGFPHEKAEDILETIKYAYGLKLDYVIFYIALPHMGSDLYDMYLKDGLIDAQDVYVSHMPDECLFGTRHLSGKEVEALRDSAAQGYMRFHLRHFLNPAYVLREFLPKICTPRRLMYSLRAFLLLSRSIRHTFSSTAERGVTSGRKAGQAPEFRTQKQESS